VNPLLRKPREATTAAPRCGWPCHRGCRAWITGNPEVIRQFPNSQFPNDCAGLKSHPVAALPNALDSKLRNIVPGAFTPVLAKHTKHLSLVDILSVGVDRRQRNFEPMRKQVEAWKGTRLPDDTAKLVIYWAFVEGKLDVPKHLARRVHGAYFNPRVEEFAPRTVWSLSNAFTSVFKDLDPIPQFKTTAKLASFLELATASSN
jgi:hypothetical protein